jgi:N-hydroxyarylamine O-acetyltransferase
MSDNVNLNAYFERVGFSGSIAPSLATLEALHALHPAAIPFENLNPLLGLPVELDQKSLEKKMLAEKRGGYCFEHNLMFMRVLADLDYRVRGLGARVLWNRPADAVRPISHMLIAVDISGQTYIADVGFGALTLTAPLRLRDGAEQATPHETFRLLDKDGAWHLEARIGEDWRLLYTFTLEEFGEADYRPINTALSSDPASQFRTGLGAAISPKGERHNLAGTRLSTYRDGALVERRELADVEELKDVLTTTFGITLPDVEALDPTLERIVAAGRAEA